MRKISFGHVILLWACWTSAVDSFDKPSRSTWPHRSPWKWQRGRWEESSWNPILPVETRTRKLGLRDHWRPDFIVRECALGARAALRLFPFLRLSSVLATCIRSSLPMPAAPKFVRGVVVDSPPSLTMSWLTPTALILAVFRCENEGTKILPFRCQSVHRLAGNLKSAFGVRKRWPLLHATTVGPALEEIAYRGFGQMANKALLMYDLCFTTHFCRLFPVVLVASLDVLYFTSAYSMGSDSCSCDVQHSVFVCVIPLDLYGSDVAVSCPRCWHLPSSG